jgi:hypothetical protein
MNAAAFTELFQVNEVVFTGEKHCMCTDVFSLYILHSKIHNNNVENHKNFPLKFQ